ncbi:hypothetical protein PG993_008905 [Apiospora rasikravindrae]|uniref:Uncharacterized protein n=1 Tax=Apiospora rasikravindrae TaxID=990691 RepID=A0ABR1SR31_9PEZI
MGVATLKRYLIFYIILLLSPISSSQEPQSNSPPCHTKSDWVNQLIKGSFDATKNCGDLEFILQAVNQDKKLDFCRADRRHVVGYIREGYGPAVAKGKRMPADCEIEQWWFRGQFPKSRVAFCKNATAIAVARDRGNRTGVTRAQPYFNLVHSPR